MKITKSLSLTLITLIGITNTGCTTKEHIIIKYKNLKTPTKCKTPPVNCNKFKKTLNSQQEELILCIKELRKANQVCK